MLIELELVGSGLHRLERSFSGNTSDQICSRYSGGTRKPSPELPWFCWKFVGAAPRRGSKPPPVSADRTLTANSARLWKPAARSGLRSLTTVASAKPPAAAAPASEDEPNSEARRAFFSSAAI
jgi:hypothetical protein